MVTLLTGAETHMGVMRALMLDDDDDDDDDDATKRETGNVAAHEEDGLI